MGTSNIVVVGAGVAGLTSALLLSRNPAYNVVVIAKHMPGDYDAEYASPWAGAAFMPLSRRGTQDAEWDRRTWMVLQDLAKTRPEAGIHLQECQIHNRTKDAGSATAEWYAEMLSKDPWFKSVVPDFRVLPAKEGMDSTISFGSLCINTALYLPWLLSQCLRNGVAFKRKVIQHISDATSVACKPLTGPADLIVNCTGLGASKLGGVADQTVIPARGQVVIVRNESDKIIGTSGTDHGDDETCYLMTRAAGGGTVLGGSYQKGDWNSRVDVNLATRIMQRAVQVCPELTGGRGVEHLDVIRHSVGFRPLRLGGTRVDKEMIGGTWVVHNYGAGGAGYQQSYGCAQDVVRLVGEALNARARL